MSINVPANRVAMMALLEGLTALNYVFLSRFDVPPLYKSGVRYRREQPGREQWLTIPEVLDEGFGDCEDLAAWRAAEIRLKGLPAFVRVVRSGRRSFHAIVQRPDGTIEDPSKVLGMKPRKRG